MEIGSFNKVPDPYREPIQEPSGAEPKIEKPNFPEITVKQEIKKEIPKVGPSQEVPIPVPPAAPPMPPPAAAPKEDGLKNLTEDRQMKMLVDLAFQQGIDKAVQAAKATGDAYLIDKFHDTLVDELRQQLIEKGKLKEE